MAAAFVFEPPSDEEYSDAEEQQPQEEEEEDEHEEDEEALKPSRASRHSESPWDFASYSETVAQEHARRSTTSVDFKISKALQQRSVPGAVAHDDDGSSESQSESEPESDKQEDYKPEDDEVVDDATNAGVGKKPFFSPSDGTSFHANSFMELHLSRPLLRACEKLGYTKPTPIQAACIPLALSGRDICGSAITGSGKTAAFALPTLERLLFRPKRVPAIRVLVLTPARELAVQVHSMIQKLAQFTDIRCCLVVGGLSLKAQEADLRTMPDIVVATPGRIIDHLRNSMSVDLDDLAVLILDEADRLLEVGFSAEIRELIRVCPKRRQTMLFSATMTEEVDELVKLSLTKPLRLSADPSAKRPVTLTEEVVRIRRMREVNQEAVLLALCSKTFTARVIIFSGTKQAAHRLKILFGLAGLKAAELHGNLTQVQRLDALELFRKQGVDYLIATDVAARGLDIIGVQTVINYACPRDLTSYVHRVGRTARAGREGYAVTFVTDNDRSLLKAIAKRAGSKLRSRIVAEQSITKWCQIIEEMEDQVATILQEEREEQALRKAEMEASKAENMIVHKDEIYSRPKRTWFVTEKEKRMVVNADKASNESEKHLGKEVISAQQAEDLKLKEKRKREREKNLPRKKRRKLEAAREMLEEENQNEKFDGSGKKEKTGTPLVDLAYRRAKAVKAAKKATDAGKIVRKTSKKSSRPPQKTQSRTEEMQDLFQSDMSQRRQNKKSSGVGNKKSKNSFKSKSRCFSAKVALLDVRTSAQDFNLVRKRIRTAKNEKVQLKRTWGLKEASENEVQGLKKTLDVSFGSRKNTLVVE
ncbi:hypothetical protein ACFX13_020609 [Malus domestica]